MSQSPDLLNLSITLTPPPAGSPPEAIASIALRCDPLGLIHTGDLLTDPLTQKEHHDLRWYLEEYWKWPFGGFAQRSQQIEASLPQLGKRLYHLVFGTSEANSLLQAWRLQPASQRQISIMSDLPSVLSLPWELLHDEQGFLLLRTRHPVVLVRRLPQRELAGFQVSFEPPLRVLLVAARPDEADFIDPRNIALELLEEAQGHTEEGTIAVELLRPPTLPALRARLSDLIRPPIQVLHFDGHGVFQQEQGLLAFENAEGKLDLVEAGMLAQVLQDSGVRLAVLTACQSAVGAADDVFSSVAAQLIGGGVDAVVAMSARVLVVSATQYAEAFYRALSAGVTAPIAQERARQALYDNPRRYVRPRSHEEGQLVELRDWWLPHFYQQRPLVLQPTSKPKSKQKKSPASSLPYRLNKDMPGEPRYGFSGRAYELLQIERYLLQGKLVVISGFGGVGKTALAREAGDWLTRTCMYLGACFVSFEYGGDSTTLLSSLGNFLGVYDGHYNPNDKAAALARLKPVLKKHPTLVIADHLESILSGGEAPLDAATRAQLWDVLLELAKLGAGILFTSRDTNFGDGRLAQGARTAHLELKGLYREDAYALATRLLTDLGINRARAPYAQLRDLLAQLDYHPLAIQLVLPALRTFSLATIRADFATLLPKFVDVTEMGRNRSLLASLDYSLRRLSDEQRAVLPRLALFEGGASEDDLLAITQIPSGEWAQLRPALEQAALLIVEQVSEAITTLFLHFHPILAPYLRSQPGADDAALRLRYARRYSALANYLAEKDRHHPQSVRALVQRELPNLRRALELLLAAGELDTASEMADRIASFLNNFGLLRERDEVRRMAEATRDIQKSGVLTRAGWLRESGLGEDERQKGNVRTAYTRFTNLLARIEALPEGTPLGRGSYEHCLTLLQLARCLEAGGRPDAAEVRLREALSTAEALLKRQPGDEGHIRLHGMLMAGLGDALRGKGKYPEAREAYEEAFNIAKRQGDLRQQAVVQGQLGTLAEMQGDYAEARSRHTSALALFHALGEPAMEADAWRQLGIVAREQKDWAGAERCYRESLALEEQLGIAGAAETYNQLATVAEGADRPAEAEDWYKQALEVYGQLQPGSSAQATALTNLASLQVNEVRTGRAPVARLAEAKGYAERALAIREKLDASSEIWMTLGILARIAELEGRTEAAQDCRRRERETFAAFAGNRYHIDRQHGPLIAAIAAAAKGDTQARKKVEAALPEGEAEGWHIAAATQRIWAGERDWHSLVEDLKAPSALLVLRVLETLQEQQEETT